MTNKPTLVAGALGDSITTAFSAHAASDNPELSWATGSAPGLRSHVERLKEALRCDVTAVNVATAGVRAVALPEQARRLAASKPDYATLLIGANDLTDWLFAGEYGSRLDAFHQYVVDVVDQLIAANRRVMLLLAAIPDQARVVELAMRGKLEAQWIDAQLLRTVRERYAERHRRANAALEQVAKGRPGNVRFAGGLAAVRFDEHHLSALDFYHPSREGQAVLSEKTWLEGWF